MHAVSIIISYSIDSPVMSFPSTFSTSFAPESFFISYQKHKEKLASYVILMDTFETFFINFNKTSASFFSLLAICCFSSPKTQIFPSFDLYFTNCQSFPLLWMECKEIINRVRDAILWTTINLPSISTGQWLYRPKQTSFTLSLSTPLVDELLVGLYEKESIAKITVKNMEISFAFFSLLFSYLLGLRGRKISFFFFLNLPNFFPFASQLSGKMLIYIYSKSSSMKKLFPFHSYLIAFN